MLESAAGTTLIGAFGVVWPLVMMAIGLMLLGVPIVDALIFGTFVAFLPQGELALLPGAAGHGQRARLPAARDPVLHAGGRA